MKNPPTETPKNNLDTVLSLPDTIPISWLDSIKDTVKPRRSWLLITTILGSSLLSTALTCWFNYYLQGKREERESKLIVQTEKRGSYLTLEKDIQKFDSDLASAVTTFRYAQSHPSDREFSKNLSASIDTVSDQMAQLMNTKGNSNIDGETVKQLSDILNQLGPMLAGAQGDPSALSKLIELYDTQLKQKISNVRARIEQMKGLYVLESSSYHRQVNREETNIRMLVMNTVQTGEPLNIELKIR